MQWRVVSVRWCCADCDIKGDCSDVNIGACSSSLRTDRKKVVFKKLEKVRKPFSCNYYGDNRLIMMQEYKAYDNRIVTTNGIRMYVTDEKHKIVAIEIKQNQEDMEEKKLNLKPFDLEAAKAGKPVCTRDGRKARIICFDANDERSIIALLEFECDNGGYVEKIEAYYKDGKIYEESEWLNDLMMLPEKHEGWINLYRDGGLTKAGWKIFPTKEEAVKNFKDEEKYITTVKIDWEE